MPCTSLSETKLHESSSWSRSTCPSEFCRGGPDVHGYLGFAIRNTNNYNYQSEPGQNFTLSGGWFHVSIPISNFGQPVDAMRAHGPAIRRAECHGAPYLLDRQRRLHTGARIDGWHDDRGSHS